MTLDRSSEAIAHFIGMFQLDAEAARMRETYDVFRATQDSPDETGELPHVTVSIRAPYELVPFDPGLTYLPVAPPPQAAAPELSVIPVELPRLPLRFMHLDRDQPDLDPAQPVASGGAPHWQVPLPGSMVTVTVQTLHLSDNDVLDFGHGHGHVFASPAQLTAQLTGLTEVARGLTLGLAELMQPGQIPGADQMALLLAQADALDEGAAPGRAQTTELTVLSGADALGGPIINGVAADEMPDIRASLPRALQREDEDEDGDSDGTDGDTPPRTGGDEDGDNPFAVDPGHHVNTGANLVANETYLASDWIDAPVISVMGDVVRLDVISQVNVLVDHDSPGLAGVDNLPSRAVNAARIETTSSAPADTAGSDDDPDFPDAWQVVRLDGDVFSLNWSSSHNFVTDFDRAEVEFSGSNTFIELGGNMLGNFSSLMALGFHYDLIIVGGRMITMNLIEQVNVLLDNDSVTGTLSPVTGLSGGDNYLLNHASISTTGIDTILTMPESFRDAGEDLASGATTIPASLAGDALFAGNSALTVLYISGDLVNVNAVTQHNYVGDADQVYLALAEFIANAGDDITVTTGSNALVNDARITDAGIDSTVLAGSDIYTDALIHQAGLIDTDAAPAGVAMPGLTNEAVAAFLASDMIDPPAGADDALPMPHAVTDGGGLDVMHSVLA